MAADHEVDLCLGTSLAEIVHVLGALPGDVVLADHFGDVDLSLVFRQCPTSQGPERPSG